MMRTKEDILNSINEDDGFRLSEAKVNTRIVEVLADIRDILNDQINVNRY